MRKRKLLCLSWILLPILCTAHPHMFIDQQIQFEFSGSNLKGFWITWFMDEMFTESILIDYDLNDTNQFEPEEVKDIEEYAFSNLENFGYYVHLYDRGIHMPITRVSNFHAEMRTDQLVYRFFVPYEVVRTGDLKLAVYDTAFWCDLAFTAKNSSSVLSADDVSYSLTKEENRDFAVTYDNTVVNSTREDANYTGYMIPEFLHLKF